MDRIRLTKVAKIVGELDKIADEIQQENEKVALHVDQISDMVEKVAFSPQTWMPGRGGPRGWSPGQRVKMQLPGKKPDAGGLMICLDCGYRLPMRQASYLSTCPKCGSPMSRTY